jgi:hypothetical protein
MKLMDKTGIQVPAAFKARLEEIRALHHWFAVIDDTVLYWKGVLDGVSAKNFRIIAEDTQRDERGYLKGSDSWRSWCYAGNDAIVVFGGRETPGKVATSAPADFRSLTHGYATDGRDVFFCGKAIKGADPASFQVVGWEWSRDANGCYWCRTKLPGADPGSFRVLSPAIETLDSFSLNDIAADNHQAYYRDRVIPGALGASITVTERSHSRIETVSDGYGTWTATDLHALMQPAEKAIVFAGEIAEHIFAANALAGLENSLYIFDLYCTHRSVEAVTALPSVHARAKGQSVFLKAIKQISNQLGEPVANITPATITITPLGRALFKHLNPPQTSEQFAIGQAFSVGMEALMQKMKQNIAGILDAKSKAKEDK